MASKILQTPLEDLINERDWLLADGATGTNYFLKGLESGDAPEFWCIDRPYEVVNLHQEFLIAGSDIILTNSFGGNSYRLKLHKAEQRVYEINWAAAHLAKSAVKQHFERTGQLKIVAGSIGPTGELFEPYGKLTSEVAFQVFKEQAEALAEGGADLLWIETISALDEVDAAIAAAEETGLPIICTMTFDTAGKTMMGVDPGTYADHVSKKSILALGANCGIGPAELLDSLHRFNRVYGGNLVAKANCGIPKFNKGEISYPMSPELMGIFAVFARDAGAKIIGGCCGTTPLHIKAMRNKLSSALEESELSFEAVEEIFGCPWVGVDFSRKSRRRRRQQQ